MRYLSTVLLALGLGVALLPAMAVASMPERTYVGYGVVEGQGKGSLSFEGDGKLVLLTYGQGILSYSKNTEVQLSGHMGIQTETDTLITLTGFDGLAMMEGDDVFGSYAGGTQYFMISGEGRVNAAGKGVLDAERWMPLQPTLTNPSTFLHRY
ncbi:MAG: hypothetical protein HYV34_03895 [Candidatus Kerfeldbacteria bacterium]|nr:hypothetical protein [Candidatus Kerfeldbacteria bacterium]